MGGGSLTRVFPGAGVECPFLQRLTSAQVVDERLPWCAQFRGELAQGGVEVGGLEAGLCPEPGPAGALNCSISGVDAEVGSSVTLGAARGPLDEADGGGPPQDLGCHAGEAGKVALIPVRLQEGRDVLGPVVVAEQVPGCRGSRRFCGRCGSRVRRRPGAVRNTCPGAGRRCAPRVLLGRLLRACPGEPRDDTLEVVLVEEELRCGQQEPAQAAGSRGRGRGDQTVAGRLGSVALWFGRGRRSCRRVRRDQVPSLRPRGGEQAAIRRRSVKKLAAWAGSGRGELGEKGCWKSGGLPGPG